MSDIDYGPETPGYIGTDTDGHALYEHESYAPEMFVDGGWSGNALRFATEAEAEAWGRDLLMRWFVPSDSRAVPSTDPVNYRRRDDGMIEEVQA